MKKEITNLTYIKDEVRIELEVSGKYPIPKGQEERWIDTATLCNIPKEAGLYYITEQRPKKTGKYPKEVNGYLYLRELAPHPSVDEVMYTEEDIDRVYFGKICSPSEVAKKEWAKMVLRSTNNTDCVEAEYDEQAPQDSTDDIDNESQDTIPDQISVTWDGDSKAVAFVKKMLSFIPDTISSKVMIFEHANDVLKLDDVSTVKRIVNIVPEEILKKYEDYTFVVYLGSNEKYDSFTFDISAVGLREFIKSEFTFADMARATRLDWDKLSILSEGVNEGLEQFEMWVLDTFADIRMYDKNIDPFELMQLYDNIGISYIQHNNGRDIFDHFVLNNDFKPVQVDIDRDIYTGYYANHVLFIKDCNMNYLRMYVFDTLLTEDEIFEGIAEDPGYIAILIRDIDFSDAILDDIRECMFSMYKQAFINYNTPRETETYKDDTSKDV